jgi:pimeloyl-ACP methyl ester carboxylesterase
VTTFVLVHPAWLGGWCWRKVAPRLREFGHDVFTPTLTGLGERAHLATRDVGLKTHIQDVVSVLELEDLQQVIIVGNSSGGVVITGVANSMPERIANIVYLDAFVPGDGQCMLDIIPPERRPPIETLVREEGDGWLVPRFGPPTWEKIATEAWQIRDEADQRWVLPRLRPTPFRHFTEAVRRDNPAAEKLPRTYIRCRDYPNTSFDRYAQIAQHSPGWRYRELATSHLPFITHPSEVANALIELASYEVIE